MLSRRRVQPRFQIRQQRREVAGPKPGRQYSQFVGVLVKVEPVGHHPARVPRVHIGAEEDGRALPVAGEHRGLYVQSEIHRIVGKGMPTAGVARLVADAGASADRRDPFVDGEAGRVAEHSVIWGSIAPQVMEPVDELVGQEAYRVGAGLRLAQDRLAHCEVEICPAQRDGLRHAGGCLAHKEDEDLVIWRNQHEEYHQDRLAEVKTIEAAYSERLRAAEIKDNDSTKDG